MGQQTSANSAVSDDNTLILPILPLFGVTLSPKMILPLVIMKEESIRLIDKAMARDRVVGFLVSRESEMKETYTSDDLYLVGTSAPF